MSIIYEIVTSFEFLVLAPALVFVLCVASVPAALKKVRRAL